MAELKASLDKRLIIGLKNIEDGVVVFRYHCPYCDKLTKKDGTIIIVGCGHYKGQDGDSVIFESFINDTEKHELDQLKIKIPAAAQEERIKDGQEKLVKVLNGLFQVGELLPWKRFTFKIMKITNEGLIILAPVGYKRK